MRFSSLPCSMPPGPRLRALVTPRGLKLPLPPPHDHQCHEYVKILQIHIDEYAEILQLHAYSISFLQYSPFFLPDPGSYNS